VAFRALLEEGYTPASWTGDIRRAPRRAAANAARPIPSADRHCAAGPHTAVNGVVAWPVGTAAVAAKAIPITTSGACGQPAGRVMVVRFTPAKRGWERPERCSTPVCRSSVGPELLHPAWQSGHRQRPEGCLLLVHGRHQIDIDRVCRVCLIATATVLELPPIGARTRRRRAYAPDATRAAKWRFRWSSQAATRSRTTTATTRAGEAGATSLLCAQIREARRSRRERASRRRRSLRAAPAPSRQTCSGSRRVHEES
jgi:hypothetical protein